MNMKVKNQHGEIVEIPQSKAISPYNALIIEKGEITSSLPEYPHQWPNEVVSHQAWNVDERRYQEAIYYHGGEIYFAT